jgi:hypothetical protein
MEVIEQVSWVQMITEICMETEYTLQDVCDVLGMDVEDCRLQMAEGGDIPVSKELSILYQTFKPAC